MLEVKSLERLIEIEADLKSQYETKLNDKAAEIKQATEKQQALQATIDKHQVTINSQIETIKELSAAKADTKHIEQLNRELNSRASKLQEEVDTQKKRIKALQKDLSAEREEIKTLKQFDAQKLKKNLDANKKKLAERTTEVAVIRKSNNQLKKENLELKQQLKSLETEAKTAEDETSAAEE